MALLERVGMQDQTARPSSVLAYGDVKRLELAMALANKPRLLLMDEPTAGMAPKERHELMQLTVDLVKERNMSVLFTEHSMDVVFSYAHKLLVLSGGMVIAEGDAQSIRDNPEVQRVYFGSGNTFEDELGSHKGSE
jgi:branched-chain amino acid transport system ATP-binding protein